MNNIKHIYQPLQTNARIYKISFSLKTFFVTALMILVFNKEMRAQHVINELNGTRELTNSFFFLSQESLPRAMAFNSDGTKMFILGINDDAIVEYNLSTAFDVSTASYAGSSEELYIGGEEGQAEGVIFNANGSKLFIVGSFSDAVIEYSLSTPYDISTGVYAGSSQELDISAQINVARDLEFNNTGTKLFILGAANDKIVQYNLSTPYDVSTGIYAGTAGDLDISPEEGQPTGMAFDEFGSFLYMMGEDDNSVLKYSLSGAYQVHTATYLGSAEDFSVVNEEIDPQDVLFAQNDNKMFTLGSGGDRVRDYTLVNHINYNENDVADIIDIDAQTNEGPVESFPIDGNLTYSLIGTDAALFTVATNGAINFVTPPDFEQPTDADQDNSYLITLVIVNDITTEQTTRFFSINVQNTADQPYLGPLVEGFDFSTAEFTGELESYYYGDLIGNAQDLEFSNDGLKMFIVDNVADQISEFTLTVPYEVTTASYSGANLDISGELVSPTGLTLSPDGLRLFVSGTDQSDKPNSVVEYHLGTAADLSTATYSGDMETLDASAISAAINGFGGTQFSSDGMTLFLGRYPFSRVYEFALSAPYNVSTGVYTGSSVDAFAFTDMVDFVITNDGTTIYALARRSGDDILNEFTLSTPFDLSTGTYKGRTDLTDLQSNAQGFTFNPEGTRFYILGTSEDLIYEYHLASTLDFKEKETTFVMNVEANDGMGGVTDASVTYSLSGTDAADFSINANGEINFLMLPDFDNPLDAGANNVYEIEVNADNGVETASQRMIITVTDKLDEVAPTFTSGPAATFPENGTGFAYIASADESVDFILGTTKDEALFSEGDSEVIFLSSPNFENPLDADKDNVYVIDLIADDGENQTTLEVSITVTDVNDEITWTGTTNNDWHTGTNWDGGVLPTSTDDVTIPDTGVDPVITAGAETNALIIDANATVTVKSGAFLAISDQALGDGQAVIERNVVPDLGYSIVGSPIEDASVTSVGADIVYGYDGSNFTVPTGDLAPGTGYFVAFDQGSPIVTFTGMPNTGDISFSIPTTDDFHLVANPYTAAISRASLAGPNSSFDGTIYLWEDGGVNVGGIRSGSYVTANSLDPTPGNFNGNIGSMQGFFVKSSFDTELTFTPSMQSINPGDNADGAFYRTASQNQLMRLTLSNKHFSDYVVIGGVEGATMDLDFGLDAIKFMNPHFSFYSKQEENALAIQAIPYVSNDKIELALGIDAYEKGIYTLDVTQLDGFSEDISISLINRTTNRAYNLRNAKSIDLSVTGSEEFVLILEPVKVLSTVEDVSQNLIAFGDQNHLTIKYSGNEMGRVVIYTLDGRVAFDRELVFINQESTIHPNLLPNRLYVLRVNDETFKFTIKR